MRSRHGLLALLLLSAGFVVDLVQELAQFDYGLLCFEHFPDFRAQALRGPPDKMRKRKTK